MNNAQINIEKIDKSTAQKMLESSFEGQRKIREGWVTRLSEEMTRNTFKLSTDAICIINGQLANGQHRLSAVVKSGKTIEFLVLRTSDTEVFKVIDCGMKRTLANSVRCSTGIAAMARLIVAIQNDAVSFSGVFHGNTMSYKLNRSELIKFIEENETEMTKCFNAVRKKVEDTGLISASMAATFLFVGKKLNEDKCLKFLLGVIDGKEPEQAILVHKRLVKNLSSDFRLNPAMVLALMIKAFNFYLMDLPLGVLKFGEKEPYPIFGNSET